MAVMTTKLDRPLKREVEISSVLYTVTIGPEGLKLVQKGHRKGHELTWRKVMDGATDLTDALGKSETAERPLVPGGGDPGQQASVTDDAKNPSQP
jgi:hypothetical protein